MAKWSKLRSLSWSERCCLLQALVLLPTLAVALRLAGLRRTQAFLVQLAPSGRTPGGQDGDPPAGRAQRIARIVRAAASHSPYRANCLEQSLALWWILYRKGTECELRIGVNRSGSGVEAHAWVELSGVALNDRDDVRQRYACFDRAIVPATVGTS